MMTEPVLIERLFAREIIDSRGYPTIETDVLTKIGVFRASIPSGASTGIHEALEIRDHDPKRFHGKGVLHAVEIVNTILNYHLHGWDVTKQKEIDEEMEKLDGTPSKENLGANSILSVSIAVSKAAAAAKKRPLYRYYAELIGNENCMLPIPAFNVLNGGKHSGNPMAIQEFMIIPKHEQTFHQALKCGCEVYYTLKTLIAQKYGLDATSVGDEGGFSPPIFQASEALDLLMEAIHKAGYHDAQVLIGIDSAASEFYIPETDHYNLGFKLKKEEFQTSDKSLLMTGDELLTFYEDLSRKYPISSIEDPFSEDDWTHFAQLQASCPDYHCLQIVGDDLLC